MIGRWFMSGINTLKMHEGSEEDVTVTPEELRDILYDIAQLEAALEVIAERRNCADNLMSNASIAVEALDK